MRIDIQVADAHSTRLTSSSSSSSAIVGVETVICAVLPVLLLIGIVSMCVKGCHKKRDSSHGSDEAELDQGDAGNTPEADMNNEANGRPVSHDRALPEIPPVPSGVTSTDDDDEEDEGHYDIISKGKKVSARDQLSASVAAVAQPSSSSSASVSASKKKARSHPYEKVRGDPDSDSVYAGIKDELDKAKLPPTGRVGVGVDGVGTLLGGLRYSDARSGQSLEASSNTGSIHSNLYATVGTGQRSHSNGFSDDAFRRSTQGLSLPVAAGADSAVSSGLSPTALVPPVPQKMFDPAEEGVGVSNGRGVPNQLDSSPSLPPRNGDASTGAVANGSNRMSDGSGRMSGLGIGPGGQLLPSIGPWTTMAAFPSLIINIGDAGSMALEAGPSQPQTTAKRVPDYSSVTARESLESLRKRQQQQQQATQMQVMQFADIDGTYDTINYDQVKMPATAGRLSSNILTTEGVYNNGSDLYAEIGTETNSARSSTYAKVGDLALPVSSHVSDCVPFHPPPPPSPPPVNTLQQLTHNLDDQTDPGYSRVDVQRPRSVNCVSTSAVHTPSVPLQHSASGRRSPVYAVVNKSRQSNRQTIHVDENVERGVRQNNSDMNSLANLYAKVSKPKDHRRTSSSGANFAVNDVPPLTSLAFGGARPKVRGPGVGTGHMGDVTRSDHGYASIDNVVNDINKAEDPDYDVVGDGTSLDGLPEYDPNYETVAVSHVPSAGGVTLRSTVHSGVAHEIMANGVVHQPRRHVNHHIHSASPVWHLPRREHIYEVVKDSSEDRDRVVYNHESSHATDL